ncbi:MAG TPA: GNAT family N-acetyltransferase [Thermoanaerobaculia bacterium]|nr:GNAT family N-acetyltransferase [Thermoanaerobaculia bacterium]
MTYDIRHNEEESRFETTVDGSVAYAAYDIEEPRTIVFTHTIVPDQLSGRGIANQLVKHALEDARSRKLTVKPQCAFVAAYIKKHPEYGDLVNG